MTGPGGLSSSPQPVTETLSILSLSAGRCGAASPAEGGGRDFGSDAGEGFPHRQHHIEIARMPLPTIILVSFRPLGPSRNFLWSDLPAQAGNDDPPLVIAQV